MVLNNGLDAIDICMWITILNFVGFMYAMYCKDKYVWRDSCWLDQDIPAMIRVLRPVIIRWLLLLPPIGLLWIAAVGCKQFYHLLHDMVH